VRRLLAALACAALAGPAAAQPGLAGRWAGELDAGAARLPLVLHLGGADGALTASLDSPAQGALGLPAEAVRAGDSLTVGVPAVGGTFAAAVRGDTLVGAWTQNGHRLPLVLRRAPGAPTPRPAVPDPAGLAGDWGGPLDVGMMELALVLHLTYDGAAYAATLDSPDQGAFGIPAEAALAGDTLLVTIPAVQGVLRGQLVGDGIEATFSQGGAAYPLVLTRDGARVEAPRRPQDPQPPFPYEVEDVTFESVSGVTLAGTVTRPEGEGPSGHARFPAVVLVSGSGPQDRDEALLGHRPFAVLADHLTRRGVLVLRYDDRGAGGSTGDFSTATSEDLAVDATAAVRWLAVRPDVSAVGVVGHSEGGVLAPIVAGQSDDVDFVVLLAGTAVRGDAVIAHQGARIAQAEGLSAAGAAANERHVAEALAHVVDVPVDVPLSDSVRAAVLAGFRAAYAALTPEDRAATGATDPAAADAELVATAGRLDEPWMRYFLAYDPAPALRALRVPALALFGEKDLQVTPDQNEAPMREALAASASPDWAVETLPGLNHLFQTAETGAISEYVRIEETMSPAVLDRVAGWILRVTGD
jgi:alpha/beta superfamily hydrolase